MSGSDGAKHEFVDLFIEQIGGGDPRARTADRAAVGHARTGGADRDARIRRRVEAIVSAVAADDARVIDRSRAARAALDARGRAGDYTATPEARSGGKECGSTWKFRVSQYN